MLTIFAALFGALIEDKRVLAYSFVLGLLITAAGRFCAAYRERKKKEDDTRFDVAMERARKTQEYIQKQAEDFRKK